MPGTAPPGLPPTVDQTDQNALCEAFRPQSTKRAARFELERDRVAPLDPARDDVVESRLLLAEEGLARLDLRVEALDVRLARDELAAEVVRRPDERPRVSHGPCS